MTITALMTVFEGLGFHFLIPLAIVVQLPTVTLHIINSPLAAVGHRWLRWQMDSTLLCSTTLECILNKSTPVHHFEDTIFLWHLMIFYIKNHCYLVLDHKILLELSDVA